MSRISHSPLLPELFADWFRKRGWAPHPHQIDLLKNAQRGEDTLLIAPTGAGKTLTGFLPSLVDLADRKKGSISRSLHTLYISPLKALAVDIERNLEFPIRDIGLDIRVETRTGDTPQAKAETAKLVAKSTNTPVKVAQVTKAKPQATTKAKNRKGGLAADDPDADLLAALLAPQNANQPANQPNYKGK